MKRFTLPQLDLLHHLADGCYHHHSLLDELIPSLISMGLPINYDPHQGYQLTKPFVPLDERAIRQVLNQKQFNRPLHFELFASLDSTNQYLKDFPSSQLLTICCAEEQTQGRGRFGRQWISPFGENIYFSSCWSFSSNLVDFSSLSLVVGLAILNALQDEYLDQDIKIKWPNDLLWNHKKLGGILIEITRQTENMLQIVIGVGLNVNTDTKRDSLSDKAWCSLYEIYKNKFDRNQLLATMIYHLDQAIARFLTEGFLAFESDWQRVDYLKDQNITIIQSTGAIEGQACGVNQQGLLRLRDKQGRIHLLMSGETTLHKIES